MTRLRPPTRRLPRLAARIACQVVRERDFRLVADRVLDLSSNGVLVGPADPVLTGERIMELRTLARVPCQPGLRPNGFRGELV